MSSHVGVAPEVVDPGEQRRRGARGLQRGDHVHGYRLLAGLGLQAELVDHLEQRVRVHGHAAVGVDLEVQVRRAALGVAGVADEPDEVAGLDDLARPARSSAKALRCA